VAKHTTDLSQRRISAMINVSAQLLKQQASPDLDRILTSDLSRQLGSFLDQACLYGSGSANNQPQGLVGLAGVQSIAIDPANLWPSLCAGEKLIEDQNVEMMQLRLALFDGRKADPEL
jgi:HK97 family phage major capsid protein